MIRTMIAVFISALMAIAGIIPVIASDGGEEIPSLQPYDISVENNIITMIQGLDEPMLVQYLENITSFGPRVEGTNASKASASYIYNAFNSLGVSVRYDNFSIIGKEYNGTNIEATLEGIDRSNNEIYLICGHYDSVMVSPGADDNGASIAAMIAISQVLRLYSFNHTIRFVAFDAEETGLRGSFHYAQDAIENGDNIVGVMNADMIGNADTEEGETKVMLYYDARSAWLFEYTTTISETYADQIHLSIEDGGYTGGSDHIPFWGYGYSAVCISEFDFSEVYHTSRDTIDNMKPSYATNVSRLMLATIASIAEPHENVPPDTPSAPSGPSQGKPGRDYTYASYTSDVEGDQVYYLFDWGDGTESEWLGPYTSGSACEATHAWDEKGTYTIRVKAKDIHGADSGWATLKISMPKIYTANHIMQSLGRLVERFPSIDFVLRSL